MANAALPAWLQAMIDSGAGAAEGLRWYTPEQRATAAKSQKATFTGSSLWMNEEMQKAADEAWKNKLRVGEGPQTYWDHSIGYHMELWLDTAHPETLLVGFQNQPPVLWFPAGQDAAALVAAIRPYLPTDLAKPRQHMNPLALVRAMRDAVQAPIPGASAGQDSEARLMVGIALSQTGQELSEIENHLMMCRLSDPRFLVQGTAQGNPNSNPTATVIRTLYSRSTVRLDWYDNLDGTLFAEIYYAPAVQQDTIKAFNERFDMHYPLDIPVDVPSLLLGFEAISVPRLQSHMSRRKDDPPRLRFYLYCLAILTNPNIATVVRPYATHPSPMIRGTVISLAAQKAPELLREMYQTETDPDLRAQIDAALKG
jgi:hypothetical protein